MFPIYLNNIYGKSSSEGNFLAVSRKIKFPKLATIFSHFPLIFPTHFLTASRTAHSSHMWNYPLGSMPAKAAAFLHSSDNFFNTSDWCFANICLSYGWIGAVIPVPLWAGPMLVARGDWQKFWLLKIICETIFCKWGPNSHKLMSQKLMKYN